jgi:amidase
VLQRSSASPQSSAIFGLAVLRMNSITVTSIPLEISADGLPIGVQCIGPIFEDRTPLHFAELLERERGGFVPPKL